MRRERPEWGPRRAPPPLASRREPRAVSAATTAGEAPAGGRGAVRVRGVQRQAGGGLSACWAGPVGRPLPLRPPGPLAARPPAAPPARLRGGPPPLPAARPWLPRGGVPAARSAREGAAAWPGPASPSPPAWPPSVARRGPPRVRCCLSGTLSGTRRCGAGSCGRSVLRVQEAVAMAWAVG